MDIKSIFTILKKGLLLLILFYSKLGKPVFFFKINYINQQVHLFDISLAVFCITFNFFFLIMNNSFNSFPSLCK